MSLDVGRLCVKIAGRDAGLRCVIVDVLDQNFVLIDGETRRRKCNIAHLEPLSTTVELAKSASHGQVAEALQQHGIAARMTKPKQAKPAPAKKARAPKAAPAAAVKAVPKAKPAAKAAKAAAPAKAAPAAA
jgi:large subunit ribosomal protein L14e